MSDTPRTDGDYKEWSSPEHLQLIQFEGNTCCVMAPEDYELLFEHAITIDRELAAANDKIRRLIEAGDGLAKYGWPALEQWNQAKGTK